MSRGDRSREILGFFGSQNLLPVVVVVFAMCPSGKHRKNYLDDGPVLL
jgi:hypothetical protein